MYKITGRVIRNGSVWIFTVILASGCLARERTVRMGVYNNPPKVYANRVEETPAGIFIDIIEYIAVKENWDIQYVEGTWEEGLERLK